MAYIYFFQNDKACAWLDSEIRKTVPRYLRAPVAYSELAPHLQRRTSAYQGKRRFFVIQDWTSRSSEAPRRSWRAARARPGSTRWGCRS
jgi:hypothetical protein